MTTIINRGLSRYKEKLRGKRERKDKLRGEWRNSLIRY
jgi:hypothetical protein